MPKRPELHRPLGWKPSAQRWKEHDQWRESSTRRGYGKKWQSAREAYLSCHPLCVACLAQGRTTPANEVDHIIPHRGDQKLFWSRSNWQPLCKRCHSRKTASENGGFGNRGGGVKSL